MAPAESKKKYSVQPAEKPRPGIDAILYHPMNLLLVTCPFGICAYYLNWGPNLIFWLNFACLIPLAKLLGDATEELAAGLKSDVVAGLLNATFGNAVEVVIMVNTLRAGLTDVVKATLLGSVLSNLLLVLGMSFFCGGLAVKQPEVADESYKCMASIRSDGAADANHAAGRSSTTSTGTVDRSSARASALAEPSEPSQLTADDRLMSIDRTSVMQSDKVQVFSQIVALVNTSMLLLSCLSFSLVTVFYNSSTHVHGEATMGPVLLPVSRMCSIIIISAYVAYIYFQLVTHREAMAGEDEDGGDEGATLSVPMSIAAMVVTTLIVSFSSNLLINSLEGVVEEAGISQHFIGIILLPIVGNACEHASAIRFAIMDKPGLSIGIAVGSSTQISLFVVPCAVLIGWAIDQPMDLNFGSLNVTVMCVSVVVVLSVVVDGQANWLQGYLLVASYLIIAVLYWYLPNELPDA